MGVPDLLLPHTVTRVRPATSTDAYNNTIYDHGDAAARADLSAWMQQDKRARPRSDGRDPLVDWWLLITNEQDLNGRDRIEFNGTVFEIDGPPEPTSTPAGFHHTEATLKAVRG